MISKKLSLMLSLTLLSFSVHSQEKVMENYDTGKNRINKIMSDDEMGVGAYTKKNAHCAETFHLAQDLNTSKIAEYFGCATISGRSFLEEALNNPLSPADQHTILARRTHAIRTLVANPDLKKKVDALLKSAHDHEQEVIKLMSDFFIGKTCPELQQLKTIQEQNPALFPLFNFLITNESGKTLATGMNLVAFSTYALGTKILAQRMYYQIKLGMSYKESIFPTTLASLMTSFLGYSVYKDYSNATEKRSKIHALNQLVKSAESLERLGTAYGIERQFTINTMSDAQGLTLLKQLRASRYNHKDTILFSTPAVHSFLYELYKKEKHLAPLFACIAEMDAYNAIATKILESQKTNNAFCFTNFIEREQPLLSAQSFWNVLVPHAVVNDITEGKHIILTGPNAGGKTTAIRALLQNIVLAQSFGVAAAQTFEYTMFDVIHSYLSISDDILNGLSLFASEVKRAQEVLQKMKLLKPKTKFFFALDELFTGTAAEAGEECAYNFVKKIAEFNGVQFVYATHFNKLKELGKNNDRCVNYKVNAPTKNAASKLVYPFTLSKGANDINVALDMAKEANLFE